MKLERIVYDIRERVSQYQDDSKITDDYIIHLIGINREIILKNELNSYQNILSPMMMQSFCLELESVPAYDCGIDFDCKTLLRTVKPLPIPIKTHNGPAIINVKTSGKLSKPFRVISKEQAFYMQGSKYSNSVYAYLDTDMHLYIISKNKVSLLLDCIYITGVFSDPFELTDYCQTCDFNGDEENACFDDMTMDYPVTGDHIVSITELVTNILVNKLQIEEDDTNDANHSHTK